MTHFMQPLTSKSTQLHKLTYASSFNKLHATPESKWSGYDNNVDQLL